MVKDIVWGMGVEEDDPKTVVKTLQRKQFFFCSAECMLLFTRNTNYFLMRTLDGRDIAKDLVCDMQVDKTNPPFTTQCKGQTYYFCSYACQMEFERHPEQYIKHSSAGVNDDA